MLLLTKNATELIRGLAEAPGADGVRISADPEAAAYSTSPSFRVEVVPAPGVDDTVLEAGGAQVFLAPEAAAALEDKVLDADLEGGGVRFAIMAQADEEPGGER